jgi:hypothetical protein
LRWEDGVEEDVGIGGWRPEIGTDGDVTRRRPRSTSDCSATEEEEEDYPAPEDTE